MTKYLHSIDSFLNLINDIDKKNSLICTNLDLRSFFKSGSFLVSVCLIRHVSESPSMSKHPLALAKRNKNMENNLKYLPKKPFLQEISTYYTVEDEDCAIYLK